MVALDVEHNVVDDGVSVIVGKGLTVMAIILVLVQPLAAVPVTVYVVFAVGVAVTLEPVEELKLEDGLQV